MENEVRRGSIPGERGTMREAERPGGPDAQLVHKRSILRAEALNKFIPCPRATAPFRHNLPNSKRRAMEGCALSRPSPNSAATELTCIRCASRHP